MWEEYEITPNNALQYRKEELTDRQAIKADVTRIKDEIRKLGSVNVNAIEDYKELLERHTFLSGQYDDIVKAEETLEGIILELDEGMRKQFTEKFRDIQREFDKWHLRNCSAEERELLNLQKMKISLRPEYESFLNHLAKNSKI